MLSLSRLPFTAAVHRNAHSRRLCHLGTNLETLLEYLEADYIRVSSACAGARAAAQFVCVCVCVSGCGHPSYLKPSLIFHLFPSSSHWFPCSQSPHLDAAGCLSAPRSHSPCHTHTRTLSPPAVNSPMCGQLCLKIDRLSLWFQNIWNPRQPGDGSAVAVDAFKTGGADPSRVCD